MFQSCESPPHSQINTSSSSGETPPTPMSKTAMLVAAAVGPLAPGFKFPKTKKVIIDFNWWFFKYFVAQAWCNVLVYSQFLHLAIYVYFVLPNQFHISIDHLPNIQTLHSLSGIWY